MIDKKRIGEIRARSKSVRLGFKQYPPCSLGCYNHVTHPCEKCGRLMGHGLVEWIMRVDVPVLLDALEEAQVEQSLLRKALRTSHRIALKRVGFRVKNEITLLEEECRICREMFLNGRGHHADDCPFKILEDGDNVMVCGETSNG